MTNETRNEPARRSEVATKFVADRLADAVEPADLEVASRVMRAAAAMDLNDLRRRLFLEGIMPPIGNTDAQQRAQANWSYATDLIERADTWRDLLDLAISYQQADTQGDQWRQSGPRRTT